MRILLLLCTLFTMVGTSSASDADLDSLNRWMEGTFSNAWQAERDTSFRHVQLRMIRIWKDRTDGAWFYVEQALATTLNAPYRQRVYNVKRVEEGMIESVVYTIKDPQKWIGLDPTVGDMSLNDIVLKFGCEVYLQYDGSSFTGSTHGAACKSDLYGASYVRSDVRVTSVGIHSWDRGFDHEGKQVWGSTSGPYAFLRISD